ncbi:hypothetical protein AB0M32_46010 [Streptomyces sp. NPDC051985]|uniref:hypothetical protein n=1 Tax=Streptomyces sp. NPDC051985 TaxID=3155807 RepID=UPI0034440C8D
MGDKELDPARPEFDPSLHVGYPTPLGLAGASEVALFIAAPLLTAGALTLIGVVCADSEKFQWPGASLLLLVLAVIALVTSIQIGYQARQRLYSYQDLKDWMAVDNPGPAFVKAQHRDYVKWFDWTLRASMTYDLGTVLLFLSVAMVLVPRHGMTELRLATIAVALAATVGQAVWSLTVYVPKILLSTKRKKEKKPPDQGDPKPVRSTVS